MKSIEIIYCGLDLGNEINKELKSKVEAPKEEEQKEKIKFEEFAGEEDKPEEPIDKPNIGMAQGENVTIPASVLQTLVELTKTAQGKKEPSSDNEDKLSKVLSSLSYVLEGMGDGNKMIGRKPVHTYEIDKDDMLDVPVMFFASGVVYTIFDDKRRGIIVKTPYERPIKFKVIQRTVDRASSRNPIYNTLSMTAISSKKELAWLREHSLYGISFHEMRAAASDLNIEMQDSLISAHNTVSSMEDIVVMQRCAAAGIAIETTNVDILRKRLVHAIAKELFSSAQKTRRTPLKSLEEAIENGINSPATSMTY